MAKRILREVNGVNNHLNGWVDEFRFSKGVARWTTNFTPPTSPYGSGTTSTNTPVAVSSPTSTPILSNTMTATQIAGNTPVSSPTSVFTPTNTSIPTWTPTNTSTVMPSNTPLPTSTQMSNPSGTPSSGILDTFNRANGRHGANWGGANSGYRIVTNQLDVRNGGAILWKTNSFGKDQEVFVTLTKVDTQGKELDLLLKAQNPTDWGEGVIEVSYNPVERRVQILTYTFAQDWVQCGANIPVTFADETNSVQRRSRMAWSKYIETAH